MRFRFALLLAIPAIVFVFPTLACAQATRTWVSGVGDDANPCSRTAPCKTFAGATSKTAVGGEISVLDPGGFGAVTISKSITIDGNGLGGAILASNTTGVIINITDATDTTKTVRLRGFTINGAGTGVDGVRVVNASKVFVEDMVIDGFTNGVVTTATANSQVVVRNSTIRNNSGSGVQAAGTAQIVIAGNAILSNGTGLNAAGGTIVSFKNNVLYGNKKDGEPTSTMELK